MLWVNTLIASRAMGVVVVVNHDGGVAIVHLR